MKKRTLAFLGLLISVVMIFTMSSCGSSGTEDETEFAAATIDLSDDVPVSEEEILAFYNNLMAKIQDENTFTDDKRPGVNTSESLNAGELQVLSYDASTGEAKEDDSLKSLNDSAKAIKDRIIGGIDTSIPIVPFGKVTENTINSVIYPPDSKEVGLAISDIVDADCSIDGDNLNIHIVLGDKPESIQKVFGVRDKEAVIASVNENSKEYCALNDYSVTYCNIEEEDNSVHSTIDLSAEVEKQADGKYTCTGRISSFNITINCDVKAHLTPLGSLKDAGDVEVNFRLTDAKNYEFDWIGNSSWEPKSETAE